MDQEGVGATMTIRAVPVEPLETELSVRDSYGTAIVSIARARTTSAKSALFAKLLENSNGKVPANYRSAYNKAKKAWVEAKKNKGAHVKAMETEEIDRYENTAYENVSSDEDIKPKSLHRSPMQLRNSRVALPR